MSKSFYAIAVGAPLACLAGLLFVGTGAVSPPPPMLHVPATTNAQIPLFSGIQSRAFDPDITSLDPFTNTVINGLDANGNITLGVDNTNNGLVHGSVILGGVNNYNDSQFTDPSDFSVICGGVGNNDQGSPYCFVGGGQNNECDSTFGDQVVVGGANNIAAAGFATVGGGQHNVIGEGGPGDWSTIPGGLNNTINDSYSFAAGKASTVNNGDTGSFVWSDDLTPESSHGSETVSFHAGGGYWFDGGQMNGNGAGLTNMAVMTLTNFISGRVYTNFSNRTLLIHATGLLTVAATAGVSELDLSTGANASGLTIADAAEIPTAAGSVAGTYRYSLNATVTNGQAYTFTNTSTGAGNSSALLSGTGRITSIP